jgi:hypothetical protein
MSSRSLHDLEAFFRSTEVARKATQALFRDAGGSRLTSRYPGTGGTEVMGWHLMNGVRNPRAAIDRLRGTGP